MEENYKLVNKMLMRDYEEIIENKEAPIIDKKQFDSNAWIKSKGKNGKPTQDIAISISDDEGINKLKLWKKVQEKTFNYYKNKYPYQNIIDLKYIKHNKDEDTYKKVGIERSWYFDRKKEIIILATTFAYKEDLIEI